MTKVIKGFHLGKKSKLSPACVPLIAVILQVEEYCGALHILHGLQLHAAGLPGGQSYLSAISLLCLVTLGLAFLAKEIFRADMDLVLGDSSLGALFSLEVVVV